MGEVKIRHLVSKAMANGKVLFYWQPSRLLRLAGFRAQRLARESNSLSSAIVEAERLNLDVDRWRAGKVRKPIQPDTLPWLIRRYQESGSWTDLAPKTQRSYRQTFKALEAWSERAGHHPIRDISRKAVRDYYHSMMATPAWANAVIRSLRLLLNFARDEGFIDQNPAERPRLRTVRPRQTVWTHEQVQAFCSTAAAEDRRSLGLAVLLGASIGQRQADILALTWTAYDGRRFRVRQRKTGAFVEVEAVEDLKEAVDATPRVAATIVVSEATKRPFREDHFRHEFARIRAKAGLPKELQFLDLRRTAVVWLAEAGCTVPEIAAITGHEIATTAKILETYCPRTPEMARNAIAKLEDHRRQSNTISTKV